MSLKVHVFLQAILVMLQPVIPVAPIAEEWKSFAHALLAGLNSAVGVLSHFYNTDGTTQKIAKI